MKVTNAPGGLTTPSAPKPAKSQQQRLLDRDFNLFMKGVEKTMADNQRVINELSRVDHRAR